MTKKNNPKRRGGLGRGMDALFVPYEETPQDHEIVEEIALDAIRANPHQPRKHFDQTALEELAESIKSSGVFQPVIVRPSSIRGYELIAGERRVRASRLAGLERIPAIIRDLDEKAMIEIAIIENLQREDLNPLEEAEAYQTMIDKLDLTQAQVAERMGKSRSYITNHLRLLSLPEQVKAWVVDHKLSMGQARTLLGVKEEADLIELAGRVLDEGLTVRQLEEEVRKLQEPSEPSPEEGPDQEEAKPKASGPEPAIQAGYVRELETGIEERFGTAAKITQRGKRGKIELEYLSQADLMRIIDLLEIQL